MEEPAQVVRGGSWNRSPQASFLLAPIVQVSPKALAELVFKGLLRQTFVRPCIRRIPRRERATSGLQVCIWVLIAGFAVLGISRNAVSAGLSLDLSQVAHKGMSADLGAIGRIAT